MILVQAIRRRPSTTARRHSPQDLRNPLIARRQQIRAFGGRLIVADTGRGRGCGNGVGHSWCYVIPHGLPNGSPLVVLGIARVGCPPPSAHQAAAPTT